MPDRSTARSESFASLLESRVALVAAHPDDEILGLGGCLAQIPAPMFIHVTDGAPRQLADALSAGFANREQYAGARRSAWSSPPITRAMARSFAVSSGRMPPARRRHSPSTPRNGRASAPRSRSSRASAPCSRRFRRTWNACERHLATTSALRRRREWHSTTASDGLCTAICGEARRPERSRHSSSTRRSRGPEGREGPLLQYRDTHRIKLRDSASI